MRKQPDTVVIKLPSKRQKPPPDHVFDLRRTWGGRLLVELNSARKTPEWLGRQVGYETPSSMRQVINGHQGISVAVYKKICRVLPIMRTVFEPPMVERYQQRGSPGPHRKHVYPPGPYKIEKKGVRP